MLNRAVGSVTPSGLLGKTYGRAAFVFAAILVGLFVGAALSGCASKASNRCEVRCASEYLLVCEREIQTEETEKNEP